MDAFLVLPVVPPAPSPFPAGLRWGLGPPEPLVWVGATGLRHSPAEGTSGGNRDPGRTQHVLTGNETWQKVGPSDLPYPRHRRPHPPPRSGAASTHLEGAGEPKKGAPRGMRLCSHWGVLIIWQQSPPGYPTSPCQPQEQPCSGTGGTENGHLALQRRGHLAATTRRWARRHGRQRQHPGLAQQAWRWFR